jgi:hypothetical protein
MFQVEVEVYSRAEDMGFESKLFSVDIDDMDFEFKMDDKQCSYNGFKELYEKLFGQGRFVDFNKELTDYVEKEFFNHTSLPCIQNLSVDKAAEYLSDLLTRSTYATGITMLDNKKIVYVDKWSIVDIAKIAEPDKVHKVKCKRTGGSSDKEYDHYIFDLDAYWSGK